MLTAWINTCPETATWTNLVEALTEVGQRKTAQQVAETRGKVLQSREAGEYLFEIFNAHVDNKKEIHELLQIKY